MRGVVVTVRDDVEAERATLADSLQAVGPCARTGCGNWTSFDLAAHVVAAERAAGALAFCVRALAARGVQFRPRPQLVDWTIQRERRDGYSALIRQLRQPSPRLLLAPAVAASTLFEVWMHHDDLTRANDLAHHTPEHLVEAIPFLMRYQASCLPSARLIVHTTDSRANFASGPVAGPTAVLTGPAADLIRWLAGRRPVTAPNIEAPPAIIDQLHAFAGRI
jgi:uncharacterized protein (TIGR03083 family)